MRIRNRSTGSAVLSLNQSCDSTVVNMAKLYCHWTLLLLFSAAVVSGQIHDQSWGYVNVRPSAYMFWWVYGCTDTSVPREDRPLVMWLQVRQVDINVCRTSESRLCSRNNIELYHLGDQLKYSPRQTLTTVKKQRLGYIRTRAGFYFHSEACPGPNVP